MKASSTKPKRVITLELDEDEATILCSLAGGIPWDVDTAAGKVVYEFFCELDNQLPERSATFSDFFKGETTCKEV